MLMRNEYGGEPTLSVEDGNRAGDRFPRGVAWTAVGVSLLWLGVSAGLLGIERFELVRTLEALQAAPDLPSAHHALFRAQAGERWERASILHMVLWVVVQAGVAVVAVHTGSRSRERRETGARLRQTAARLDAIIRRPGLGYVRVDHDGRVAEANGPWLAMHGYARLEDARGLEYSVNCTGNDLPHGAALVEAVAHGRIAPFGESTHTLPDGSHTYHAYSLHPTASNGSGTGVEGFFIDLTEKRLADATLRQALDEKTDLVHELHHRVKNNLQVLSSLIHLHLPHLTDGTTRELLQTYQRRIHSIAAVHEVMYRANDFSRVDLSEILPLIVRDHQRSVPGPVIAWRIHAVRTCLPVDIAIPCGMIVSELVSNAIRHAFPGMPGGHVDISLEEVDGGVEIEVRDDGVGFVVPGERQLGPRLGLALVDLLTEQIQGRFHIASDHGTLCRLRVPRVVQSSANRSQPVFDGVPDDLRCRS